MNETREPLINDSWIISCRGKKNRTDPFIPYAWLVEKERTVTGEPADVGTIFLTNRECPFRCLMCDLWKNTTDNTVPDGAIPAQIEWALERMPPVKHLKLYNSGSFFDRNAIPVEDYKRIAELLKDLETIIVESHPAFIDRRCLDFRDMLHPELQVAIGLEIADSEILGKLNKKMSPGDFSRAVKFLSANGIRSRAFILLRPPFLTEEEGIYRAEKSLAYAFSSGVECCTVIPVRGGNGAMEKLQEQGLFATPDIRSLERVLESGIGMKKGRVFADTWDLRLFSSCGLCLDKRIERITQMNLTQAIDARIDCQCDNQRDRFQALSPTNDIMQ